MNWLRIGRPIRAQWPEILGRLSAMIAYMQRELNCVERNHYIHYQKPGILARELAFNLI
jgi:hypothetical protein